MIEEALLAIAAGDTVRAIELASGASTSSRLAAELVEYLDVAGADVYAEPTGFTAFIDNGGNVELYDRTIAALRTLQDAQRPTSVLDIGCGDGRVTAGARADAATSLTLVEPAAALLDQAVARLAPPVDAHAVGIEPFLDTESRRWELAQSTFALHNLPRDRRRPVLERLRASVDRLVIVEFDVPDFEDRSPAHAAYAARTYERGIAEYPEHPDAVAGFLLPVLVAQFDPERVRHTFEQPAASWIDDLDSVGFESVTATPISDYWWAPAVLFDASG